jgi:hypothetical protein
MRVWIFALTLALLLTGCAGRPLAPPPGASVSLPFGAIDVNELHFELGSAFEDSLEKSFQSESQYEFDPDRDGVRTYSVLALSGGGSRGAFGAGLLSGWTKSGTRPEFKVVSGVSTGALQATFAFLGPDYDDVLREIYTTYSTTDIYRKRWALAGLFSESIKDTAPLQNLIEKYVTEEVLLAVARQHQEGHRLFVGTTNLDTTEFIIWDMGRIASSGRKDALEHYRRVLVAATAIPVLFPPVYFEVEADDEIYHEMHVDGATYAQLFFRGFMLDFEDAMEDVGIKPSKAETKIYIVRNGKEDEGDERAPVRARAVSVASTTIEALFKLSATSALYRVYVLANRNGIDFNLAAVPQDYVFDFDVTEFDAAGMQKLFNSGYNSAKDGYEWIKSPSFLDSDELFKKQ